ncbi:MAG: FmdB family zinc ribbon protein [Anaerolineae bacterium]
MPLYEYECQECGLRFERRQSFSDEPVRTCPDCGGHVERLIQPAGIIFKGSGFYVTDNRSRSSTAIPGSRKEDGESSSEKTDTTAKKETKKATSDDN